MEDWGKAEAVTANDSLLFSHSLPPRALKRLPTIPLRPFSHYIRINRRGAWCSRPAQGHGDSTPRKSPARRFPGLCPSPRRSRAAEQQVMGKTCSGGESAGWIQAGERWSYEAVFHRLHFHGHPRRKLTQASQLLLFFKRLFSLPPFLPPSF